MTHIFDEVQRLDPVWRERAQAHLDILTKPPGSLGRIEEIAAQLVAIQENDTPDVSRKAVFVFAADHGITVEGVSAYPSAVTEQMVLNFLHGGAAINVLARNARAEVHVVDIGVDAEIKHARLISRKVRRGTRSFLQQPAMSNEELRSALQVGSSLAEEAHAQGLQLFAVGEMGIGNTTSASAITAALTGEKAEQVTGMGTGVRGATLKHKIQVVQNAIEHHFPSYVERRPDPLDVLRCVGGFEIAAICGFVLAAAQRRLAVVLDGFISTAAGAVAYLLAPGVRDYLFAGHVSQERGHRVLLEFIGLRPLLDLDLRLGEGTGAVLTFNIIEAAVRIYNEMATFESAGVSGAVHG